MLVDLIKKPSKNYAVKAFLITGTARLYTRLFSNWNGTIIFSPTAGGRDAAYKPRIDARNVSMGYRSCSPANEEVVTICRRSRSSILNCLSLEGASHYTIEFVNGAI